MTGVGPMPAAEYSAAWAELRGYVQQAAADGEPIDAQDLLAFMDELRRRALAPVRQWARKAAGGQPRS